MSATSCVIYFQALLSVPLIPVVIAVLAFFALLAWWGITDSANVAYVCAPPADPSLSLSLRMSLAEPL